MTNEAFGPVTPTNYKWAAWPRQINNVRADLEEDRREAVRSLVAARLEIETANLLGDRYRARVWELRRDAAIERARSLEVQIELQKQILNVVANAILAQDGA